VQRADFVGGTVVPREFGDARERFFALLDGIRFGRRVLSGEGSGEEKGERGEGSERLETVTES
jgi:hypothetical protein